MKREYYFFLRRVYQMEALEAWNYIKRLGLPPTAEQIKEAINERLRREL